MRNNAGARSTAGVLASHIHIGIIEGSLSILLLYFYIAEWLFPPHGRAQCHRNWYFGIVLLYDPVVYPLYYTRYISMFSSSGRSVVPFEYRYCRLPAVSEGCLCSFVVPVDMQHSQCPCRFSNPSA